jgi:hypothetical protein
LRMKIGSLALHSFDHTNIIQQLRVKASPFRLPDYLYSLAALIIPRREHIHDLDFSKWMWQR